MEQNKINIDGTKVKTARKKILWTTGIFSLAAAVLAAGTLILRGDIKINPMLAQNYEVHGVDVSHYQGTISRILILR